MKTTQSEARTAIREWLRAIALAALLLLVIHLFVLRWITVRNTSMYPTLWPGDLVLVQRWVRWTGPARGDVVVFRDPLKDRVPYSERPLLVKRVVGLPGDTIQVKAGVLHVNGQQYPVKHEAYSHLVRLLDGDSAHVILADLGLPPWLVRADRTLLELPLDSALRHKLEARAVVDFAEPLALAKGAPAHVFPFSPRWRWNSDDFGPIVVPGRGDTLRIDVDVLPLYDRLISVYEGRRIAFRDGSLEMDGMPLERYVVQSDYFFVLGDNRHQSADSRYWGFLPADHVEGRAAFVLGNKDPYRGGMRWSRMGAQP